MFQRLTTNIKYLEIHDARINIPWFYFKQKVMLEKKQSVSFLSMVETFSSFLSERLQCYVKRYVIH